MLYSYLKKIPLLFNISFSSVKLRYRSSKADEVAIINSIIRVIFTSNMTSNRGDIKSARPVALFR